VALTPDRRITLDGPGAFDIDLVTDASMPAEGYRLSIESERLQVRAPDALGAQYGTAAALEALGFRFRHPFDTFVPVTPELDRSMIDGEIHAPETRVRGLHLHTLHPIESYYAFWEPSPGSTNDAHRIIDWIVKNRGNYVQWVALDDILESSRYAAWKPFTRELIDYAHARGVRTGLNMQLFGMSNLQLAYDLVDSESGVADQIAARLPAITKDLPFDVYDLSFGEFFGADPSLFIAAVNEVHRQLAVLAPQAEMHAIIHVGNNRVSYMGEDLLYYFLVKYADPDIVSDVHSTMFYTLFETTSGAYNLYDFHEHRDYLYELQCAGRRPAYHPETAYWYAFDDSIPQLLPLYVGNRWRDLAGLRAMSPCPEIPLDNQLLFSSGWEWGYWLNDVTALRASYELPALPGELVVSAFGHDLVRATQPVLDLADLQHRYLHLLSLMPYIAGRDVAIDLGRQLGIVSQPDRITFQDIVSSGDTSVVKAPLFMLRQYRDELDAIEFSDIGDDRWADELRDGYEIDRLRVQFVIATYEAVIAHVEGDEATARVRDEEARGALAAAKVVVTRRHAALHDTHHRRLVDKSSDENPNRTFYQYGYLYNADTLCFWQRELLQVEGILGRTSVAPPGCLLP